LDDALTNQVCSFINLARYVHVHFNNMVISGSLDVG